jgi:integrase
MWRKSRWEVDRIPKHDSAMFDSQREAKEKLAAILNSRPKRTGQFRVLTDNFLAHYEKLVEKGERERSTIRQLKQHINLHILPDSSFATLKCSDIGTPEVQLFLDRLIDRVSPAMSTKIRNTLSRVFSHGARRGFVSSNPVQYTQIERRVRPDAGEAEHFELPSKDDLKALLAAASLYDNTGRATAVVRLLMFCGLRDTSMRAFKSNRGGSPKRLQKLMGHATLKLTLDTYGHLWLNESADKTRARDVEKALGI